MDYIPYIERTHEYYRSQGYEKTYNYAHNEDIPFTPLEKPLSECRVTLVTTASIPAAGRGRPSAGSTKILGTNEAGGVYGAKRLACRSYRVHQR